MKVPSKIAFPIYRYILIVDALCRKVPSKIVAEYHSCMMHVFMIPSLIDKMKVLSTFVRQLYFNFYLLTSIFIPGSRHENYTSSFPPSATTMVPVAKVFFMQ